MPRKRKSAKESSEITKDIVLEKDTINGVIENEAKQAEQKMEANVHKENVQGNPRIIVEYDGQKYPKVIFENPEKIRVVDLRKLPVVAYRELQRARTEIVHSKRKG